MHPHKVGISLCAVACFSVLVFAQATPQQTTPAAPAGTPAQAGAPQTPGPGRAGTVQGTPASDPVKAAAVLADARKALGGEDKFKAIQRLEIKGKSARAAGQQNIEGDFEYLIELPDKFRRRESISFGQQGIEVTQILNGADVIEESAQIGGNSDLGSFGDGGGGDGGRGGNRGGGNRGRGNFSALFGGTPAPAGADPETVKEAQRKSILTELSRLTTFLMVPSPEPMVWVGVAESPDGKADVLEFKTPDGVATQLLIDSASRVPLMLSWVGVPTQLDQGRGNRGNRGGQGFPQGGDAQGRRGGAAGRGGLQPIQMHFSDYKTVSGIKLPHLIQRGANGETTEEFVVKSYKVNPSFKADTFKK